LVVADTRIFENTAGAGGGLFNGGDGAMTILTTVIRGNHALGNGGGIDNIGDLTVVDSTIAGNDAPGGGGGH